MPYSCRLQCTGISDDYYQGVLIRKHVKYKKRKTVTFLLCYRWKSEQKRNITSRHKRRTEVLLSDLKTSCKDHAKICGTRTTKEKINWFYTQNTFLIVHPHQEVKQIWKSWKSYYLKIKKSTLNPVTQSWKKEKDYREINASILISIPVSWWG